MRNFYNPCRVFALNDEAGLVMCEWPEGTRKPMIPIPYSQEVMTGFEYAAAILMIQSGLVEEGLTVVSAIRDRYDGEKRNPWNEIECGSNYARTLASYALLNAFSGFAFDLSQGMITFNPIRAGKERFQVFWSLASGWGRYCQSQEVVELEVLYGRLELRRLRLPFLQEGEVKAVRVGGQPVTFTQVDGELVFNKAVRVGGDAKLSVVRSHSV